MANKVDLFIRGHGIAGALLAEVASSSGLRVKVCDGQGPSSSRVAAGLYTPVTGKRLNAGWGADEALPVVRAFYPRLETLLGARFHHQLPTLRIFASARQRAEWETKPRDPCVGNPVEVPPPLHAPHGAVVIEGGGWVDLPVMLDALRSRREQRGEWGDCDRSEKTVWCTGHSASIHPLWKEAGWRNAHGDLLTVRVPGLPETHVIGFGRFLLPLGNGTFRLGATYTWNDPVPRPREEGRRELEETLRHITDLPCEVLDHRAGIRPVALARVPLIGPHPEDPTQWIFNGFGSKGVLHVPWLAERLVIHWQSGEPLPKETWAPRRIQRQRDRKITRGSPDGVQADPE